MAKKEKVILCIQCGKPAVYEHGEGIYLCIDCSLKFQQISNMKMINLAEHMNFLLSSVESSAGVPRGLLPRYSITRPVINEGPINFNNFKIDNSTIGVINTGVVQEIDISMDNLKESGNAELIGLLKQFTELVVNENKINVDLKNDILEQLSTVTGQINLPKEKQKKSVIRSLLSGIGSTVKLAATVPSLIILWEKIEPLINNLIN